MVHKDDMCAAFKTLRSVDRIEILCGMLQLCVPLELRFIGSCLEDLIQKNYKAFYEFECTVNDPKQLSEISKVKNEINREYCGTLNMYLSLLHSDNTSCSLSLYTILNNLKDFVELQFEHSDSLLSHILAEKNDFIEDVILLFTMASYHPAFTLTQRLRMYTVCKSLKETLKQAHSQIDSTECQFTFSDNEKFVKNVPVEIFIEDFKYDQSKHFNQLLVHVCWSDSTVSKCWKSREEFLSFHSNLLQAFPDATNLNNFESSFNSACVAEESNLIREYFKELSLSPSRHLLYNDIVHEFISQNSSNTLKSLPLDENIQVNNGYRSNINVKHGEEDLDDDGDDKDNDDDDDVQEDVDDEENQLTICNSNNDKQTSSICNSNIFNNIIATTDNSQVSNDSSNSNTSHNSNVTSPMQSPFPSFTSGPDDIVFDNDVTISNNNTAENAIACNNNATANIINGGNFINPISYDNSPNTVQYHARSLSIPFPPFSSPQSSTSTTMFNTTSRYMSRKFPNFSSPTVPNHSHPHRSGFNISNNKNNNFHRGSNNIRNNNYEMKAKSVHSLPRNEKLLVDNLLEPRDSVLPDKTLLEMKCCEEISSQNIMTKIVMPNSEGCIMGNPGLNNALYLCPVGCGGGIGAGDQAIKHQFNCSKFDTLEMPLPFFKNQLSICEGKPRTVSGTVTTETMASVTTANPGVNRNDPQQQIASNLKKSHQHNTTPEPFPQTTSLVTTMITTTSSNVRALRPILGASVNQLPHNTSLDDSKVPPPNSLKSDLKSSQTTVTASTLPRPSSCGCILQHEHDQNNNFSSPSDMNYPFANFYAQQYPTNYLFGTIYNGLDQCLLPPPGTMPPFNQQLDQSHSTHNFPINGLPSSSYMQTNSFSTAPCSSATTLSNPLFSSYSLNIWPHPAAQMYFRSNGLVNPRFPPPTHNFRGNIYMPPPPLEYSPYANPHNLPPLTVQSVPSTANVPSLHPTTDNQPQYCCNCGAFGHMADTCTEPFMVSIGQSAQFKLRTVPKSETSQS